MTKIRHVSISGGTDDFIWVTESFVGSYVCYVDDNKSQKIVYDIVIWDELTSRKGESDHYLPHAHLLEKYIKSDTYDTDAVGDDKGKFLITLEKPKYESDIFYLNPWNKDDGLNKEVSDKYKEDILKWANEKKGLKMPNWGVLKEDWNQFVKRLLRNPGVEYPDRYRIRSASIYKRIYREWNNLEGYGYEA